MIPAGMPMGFLDKFLDWHVIYFVDYNRQNRHVFTGYNRCMGVEVVLKVLHLFQMRVLEQMEERMKRICAREEVMGC